MVISDMPVEGGMKITINHDHIVQPCTSATLEEARAAPKCGPPPQSPPWGVTNPWNLDIDGRPFPAAEPALAETTSTNMMTIAGAAAAALAVGVAVGKRISS